MSKYGPAWVWPATGQQTSPSLPSLRQTAGTAVSVCPPPLPAGYQGPVQTQGVHPGTLQKCGQAPRRGHSGHSLRKR